jgi:hypothetical protein
VPKTDFHEELDPDREVNPIILQFMAKSTLRAVMCDKNALSADIAKRGVDVNVSRQDLTDTIFSQLKNERLARVRELQRQFLTYLMQNNSDHTGLLKNVFCAFARAVKEEKASLTTVVENEGATKGWKKLRNVKSQPDFGRLMKGLKRGQQAEIRGDDSLIGAYIQILNASDKRAACTGLQIKSESAKGQAWELSDGSYVTKEHQGTRWIIAAGANAAGAKSSLAAQQSPLSMLTRSPSSSNIRRRPSLPELRRTDAKAVPPSSHSKSKRMVRRNSIE